MPGWMHSSLPKQDTSNMDTLDDVDDIAIRVAQIKVDTEQLLRALALENHDEAVMVASRLRHELQDIERVALARGISDPDRYDEIVSGTVHLQDEVQSLLDLAPRVSSDAVGVRRYLARMGTACLSRYRRSSGSAISAPNETLSNLILKHADLQYARLDGATLRNVIAQEANLSRAFAPGITLLRVDLSGASLQGTTLDACRAEDSCFATASMSFAALHGATAARCDFHDAVLCEVNLERAAFIGCNFRGTTFEATRADAGTTGAIFIRCDLRGTRWGGRDLTGVRFEDCKMSGLRGRPRADGVVVVRPDLSAAGDGSGRATVTSPEKLWPGLA